MPDPVKRSTTVYSVGEAIRYQRRKRDKWWSAVIPCARGLCLVGGPGEPHLHLLTPESDNGK